MIWSLLVGLGAVVLALLGAVVLALCLPWFVSLAARTAPAAGVRLELRPFGRRFPLRLRFRGPAWRATAPEPARPADIRDGARQARRRRWRTAGRRVAPRLLRNAPLLLRGLGSMFRVERLALSGRLGLPDPADTGQLFGVILPLSRICASERVAIEIEPVFDGPALEGEAEACLRVWPVRALPAAILFAWRAVMRPA